MKKLLQRPPRDAATRRGQIAHVRTSLSRSARRASADERDRRSADGAAEPERERLRVPAGDDRGCARPRSGTRPGSRSRRAEPVDCSIRLRGSVHRGEEEEDEEEREERPGPPRPSRCAAPTKAPSAPKPSEISEREARTATRIPSAPAAKCDADDEADGDVERPPGSGRAPRRRRAGPTISATPRIGVSESRFRKPVWMSLREVGAGVDRREERALDERDREREVEVGVGREAGQVRRRRRARPS